jgi:hypothetical protein
MGGGKVVAEWNLDGLNLLPRLSGKQDALPTRPLYWRKGGKNKEIAMRYGDLKLHFTDRSKSPGPALHDLSDDIGEAKDLAATLGETVKEMRATWEQQQAEPI